MSASIGRSLRLKVATSSGGSYSVVAGIESVTFERDGITVDVTTLSDADLVKLLAIKDAKISASGNYEPGDTNGQVVIEASYENNTALFAEVLYNGTNGWKKECKVSKFTVGAGTKDKLSVSIELEGTGATSTV